MKIKILIIMSMLVFLPSIVFSHPAQGIDVSFMEMQVVVKVSHQVKNSAEHFINSITIELNGAEIVHQKFLAQSTDQEQAAVYNIPSLKKGDVLKVKTVCNKFGTLDKEIKY